MGFSSNQMKRVYMCVCVNMSVLSHWDLKLFIIELSIGDQQENELVAKDMFKWTVTGQNKVVSYSFITWVVQNGD
jgi:hypothetical protein